MQQAVLGVRQYSNLMNVGACVMEGECVCGWMQVEEMPKNHMIRAYVNLQEGAVMEGDARINEGIRVSLQK